MSAPRVSAKVDLSRYSIPVKEDCHPLVQALTLRGIKCDSVLVLINGGMTSNPYRIISGRLLTRIAHRLKITIRVYSIVNYAGKRYKKYDSTIGRRNYPDVSHRSDRSLIYPQVVKIARYRYHFFIHEKMSDYQGNPPVLRVIESLSNLDYITWEDAVPLTSPKLLTINLQDIIDEQRLFSPSIPHARPVTSISYVDVETVTKPYHVPILYGRYTDGKFYMHTPGYDKTLHGFKYFLDAFPPGFHILYFHNLRFDWNVIKSTPHLHIQSILKKDSTYYSVTARLYNKTFEFRDSYKYIPHKLEEFGRMFSLPSKIDLIIYDLYTATNTSKKCRTVSVSEVLITPERTYDIVNGRPSVRTTPITNLSDYILLDGRVAIAKKYQELASDWFSKEGYRHMDHYKFYLRRDCELLWRGMEAYRANMQALLEIDCHTRLTLPSLVHQRMIQRGCYKGIYELSDNLREFVAGSVHGGRVASRHNLKWDVRADIQVIDGRSLYPSAIKRICQPTEDDNRIAGFPCGPARIIEDWASVKDSKYHYVVKIRLLSIGKSQQIPFVSYYADKSRHYTNSIEEPLTLTVDKITLEDWVVHQAIDYSFIEGIYWPADGNTTAGDVVAELYAARRSYIAEGNESMGQVCKLALNSLFGKTILKPHDTRYVIKRGEEAEEYMVEHFDELYGNVEKCGDNYIMSIAKNDIEHSNLAHIGGLILSMARRIMNEVIGLANDNGVVVTYTDTDSMHIIDRRTGSDESGLGRLIELYSKRYGRELMGTGLGQFGLELKYPGCKDIKSTRTIVLGKKAYYHYVEGTNSEGERTAYEYWKMKGINKEAIKEYPDITQLFERLYAGEVIPFDLAYGDGVVFQIRGTVVTKEKFIRRVSYTGDIGKL